MKQGKTLLQLEHGQCDHVYITHPKAGTAKVIKITNNNIITEKGFTKMPTLISFMKFSPFYDNIGSASIGSINKYKKYFNE